MNTFHIGNVVRSVSFAPPAGERHYCIGVKNSHCSLERLQAGYPTMKIERLPEVINPRYMHYGKEYCEANHTLQPAWVVLPAEAPFPAAPVKKVVKEKV